MRETMNRWALVAVSALVASCSSNAARSDAALADAAVADAANSDAAVTDATAPGPCTGLPGLKITIDSSQKFSVAGDNDFQASLVVTYANRVTQDLTSLISADVTLTDNIVVTSHYAAQAAAGTATVHFHKFDDPGFVGTATTTVDLQSCTEVDVTLHFDQEVDAHPAIDAKLSVDAGTALTWYFTCPDGNCIAPLDAGLTDDSGVPCPAVGTSCTTLGQSCGTSNPGVHCGATEVCDDHDPTTDNHGCPI